MSVPKKSEPLLLIGDSSFAEIAFEYFTKDSPYEVVAFSVEKNYLRRSELFGRPVVPFEELPERYPAQTHAAHVAIPYTQLNRLRLRLGGELRRWGYRLASYVSSRVFVWDNVKLGEHCFIFEDNTVQPFVTLEDFVILWSGNHIGHHSCVREGCFVSSHVVVSGHCEIGRRCFLGVNATIGNNVKIGDDCWLGPGTTVVRDVAPGTLFKGKRDIPEEISSLEYLQRRGLL